MNSYGPKEVTDSDNSHARDVQAILGRSRKWKCLYAGCNRKSIFSHAISESISLASIAEHGHLTTVISRRHGDTRKLRFDTVGIHNTTAFNGFCIEHDSLFSDLDTSEITDVNGLMLQAYRSVIAGSTDESRLAELQYKRLKEVNIANVIESHSNEYPFLREEKGRVLFTEDFTKMAEAHRRRAETLKQIPQDFYNALDKAENRPLPEYGFFMVESLSHHIAFRRLRFKVPVALNCVVHTVVVNAWSDYFFTVIPYEHSSLVMGMIPKRTEQPLLNKLTENFESDIGTLDLVESLISCSNEWYMTPSVLAEMSPEKREVFLQDSTCHTEQHFYERYDVTLFDSLRKHLAELHPELAPLLRIDKIDEIPLRESFDVRHKRMIDAIVKQPVELRDI
jgi:hypothetical protein